MSATSTSYRSLVSVAVPVRNGEAYVADTIQSILDQDYQNLEVIITDNASDDNTGAICQTFADRDRRVRYVRNAENLGAGPNHNLGFRLSRGDFFKWCAADDLISPNFISACVAVLQRTPEAVIAFPTVKSIDETGSVIPLVGRCMTPHRPDDSPTQRFFRDLIDRGTCTNFEVFGLVRTKVMGKTCLQQSYYGADQTLVSELALHGSFVNVDEAVLYNREHPHRSINIRDPNELLKWQDTRKRGRARPTNWYRLVHLLKIVATQRDPKRALRLCVVVLLWLSLKARDSLESRLAINQESRANGALV